MTTSILTKKEILSQHKLSLKKNRLNKKININNLHENYIKATTLYHLNVGNQEIAKILANTLLLLASELVYEHKYFESIKFYYKLLKLSEQWFNTNKIITENNDNFFWFDIKIKALMGLRDNFIFAPNEPKLDNENPIDHSTLQQKFYSKSYKYTCEIITLQSYEVFLYKKESKANFFNRKIKNLDFLIYLLFKEEKYEESLSINFMILSLVLNQKEKLDKKYKYYLKLFEIIDWMSKIKKFQNKFEEAIQLNKMSLPIIKQVCKLKHNKKFFMAIKNDVEDYLNFLIEQNKKQ